MFTGKRTILALAITALTSGYALADVDGGGGKITFSGLIINAPCSIQADDVDKQVNLGEVPASYINANTHSDAVDSSLHLINCDLPNSDNGDGDTVSKVDVTFSSGSVEPTDSNLMTNTYASGANNVGIRLLDKNSANITLGAAHTVDLITTSATQILPFKAWMEKTGSADVTPGGVTATANYTLIYK
ncbi:fimbrial protein [Pseudocitrobacter cyperus]|uniref:Fimbrial protein n=1 Tax=Pseudocitrobacter cyperus TaxID=3112843 RepID=A0ABV0HIL0_9ENTR